MNTAPKSPNMVGANGPKSNNARAANSALNTIGNAANNTLNTITNAANNTLKSIGNVATNTVNTIGNSLGAAVNTTSNGLNGAAKTVNNTASKVAANLGNSMRNLGAPLNANLGEKIQNSIETIPVHANSGMESVLPSFLSVPILIGISLMVALIGITYAYREQIAISLETISNAISDFFNPPTPAPAPSEPKKDEKDEKDEKAEDDGTVVNKEDTVVAPEYTSVIDTMLPKRKKQVFNVSENKYVYSDAEPLCKALGAELATYDQVKKAWDSGADWCNYGWIKGQAAVYPTQKSTFDKLQSSSSDDERLSCGTVGINGGFMDNPELRFGVTCYGDKPSESEHDVQNMMRGPRPPLTPEVIQQKKKELRFKNEQGSIGVMPFKDGSWSQ